MRERIVRCWTIGRIGGFDLTCDIRPGQRDERLQPELVLERTDFPQSIDIAGETTAIGIIARLERVLDRMEAELEQQRRRAADAKVRLAGFEPRLGETFPLQDELDGKLEQLAEIEADLASTEGIVNGDHSMPSSRACWITGSSTPIPAAKRLHRSLRSSDAGLCSGRIC